MNHGGGKYGPREDDELKREVRSELQAGHATRAEEWVEPEPPGDDQPEATWAPAGRPSPEHGPDADQLELRSDLARHLARSEFPAWRDQLPADLASRYAPQPLADLVAQLPADVEFHQVGDIARALGLPDETRGGG
ncbi:MAG TPA: DUF2795 domain-containing protein [Streptosporangiaceae bacterium]